VGWVERSDTHRPSPRSNRVGYFAASCNSTSSINVGSSDCDRTGCVCETHPDRPFKMFSKRADACECGGAGVPCPVRNTGEPTYVPPEFKALLGDTGPRH
jgi:hypothetical protein